MRTCNKYRYIKYKNLYLYSSMYKKIIIVYIYYNIRSTTRVTPSYGVLRVLQYSEYISTTEIDDFGVVTLIRSNTCIYVPDLQ
jgi:hypothetical protein